MFQPNQPGQIRIKQIPQGQIIYAHELFRHFIIKFNSENKCNLSFIVENGIKGEVEGIVALKFAILGEGKAKIQAFLLKNKAQDEGITHYTQYALAMDLNEFIELNKQLLIAVNDTNEKIIPNNRTQGIINGINTLCRSMHTISKDMNLESLAFNITAMDRIHWENNSGYEPFQFLFSFSINACEKIDVISAIFNITGGFELKSTEAGKYHFTVTHQNLCNLERLLTGRYSPESSCRKKYTALVGIENIVINHMVSENPLRFMQMG